VHVIDGQVEVVGGNGTLCAFVHVT
jgi:hypothetical protein